MTEQPLSNKEIRRLRNLIEVEDIRHLKNLYSHLMDLRRLDDLAELYTEDAVCDFGSYGTWEGRKTIHQEYKNVYVNELKPIFSTLHFIPNFWVELVNPTKAVGRSYLLDIVTAREKGENPIELFGVYDEEFRKVDGKWLIARSTLLFLWPERTLDDNFSSEFPPIS